MRTVRLLGVAVLVAVAGCQPSEDSSEGYVRTPALNDGQRAAFAEYAEMVADHLGTFDDITVYDRPSPDGPWELVAGKFVPVTVHGANPDIYVKDMVSDRPMMLPTRVQGYTGGDGQSSPYSVAGRMPASNPEVQWIWVVRQYSMKTPYDADFDYAGDIAVIGHHPRTGASAYYQFYEPANPRSAKVVVSPFSEGGADFWSPIDTISDNFQCQRCHDAGPFIHTPWSDQVRVRDAAPGEPLAEPIVPSDPLGPFFFITGPEVNGKPLFAFWDSALAANTGGGHLNKPANACTECHRISPDLVGLNQNSTRYVGLETDHRKSLSVISDGFQTLHYRDLPWMPPVSMPSMDFYAGQETVALDSVWHINYGADAAEVNRVTSSDSAWQAAHDRNEIANVPAPPPEYRKIMVDRPEQDRIEAGESMWVVDVRMKANSDGDLEQWRFWAKGEASDVTVQPVVYRRRAGDGSQVDFEVVFVGEPRDFESGQQWVDVDGGATFDLQQGDYLGAVFTNGGGQAAPGPIPYTMDEWARLKWPDGSTRYLNGYGHWAGYVTLKLRSSEAPEVGKRLIFEDADYQTYSFEFKNRL